jgi:hypothetical protein
MLPPVRPLLGVFGAVGAVLLSGCYSHAVLVTVHGTNPGFAPWGEREIAEATVIVETTAAQYGLTPSRNVERFQHVWAQKNGQSYRVVAVYGREADKLTNWSRILLVAAVEEETSDFVVLLRDWDSTSATHFTKSLQDQLISSLSSQFAPRSVEVRLLRDMPSWYVP